MTFTFTLLQSFGALCLVIIILVFVFRRETKIPRPPGPKPQPVIGNLHQIPKEEPYRVYTEWAKKYGPLMSFRVFGQQFVMINTFETAMDLLEKRSNLYSSRPHSIMGDLVGRDKTILFTKYGATLKECRKIVHSWMNKGAIDNFLPAQEASSFRFLAALLDNPDDFSKHIRITLGSAILKLTYGMDCVDKDDPHFTRSEEFSDITAKTNKPGKWWCDSFPILAKVPAWVPGAGFQRWAAKSKVIGAQVIQAPYERIVNSVYTDKPIQSWTLDSLFDTNGGVKTGFDANALMVAAGSMYTGGIDTSAVVIKTFFLMMARHPEIQRKAQNEIDAVVGHDRLPNWKDHERLPYVRQIIDEVLRINPSAPLIPHGIDQDDVYNGYWIPKDSWVVVNNWAIFHDPQRHRNPEEFRPERFDPNGENEENLVEFVFGYGRRSCPGYYYAQPSVFLNIAPVLAAFNISPLKDEHGNLQVPPLDFDFGHVRMPADFKCCITPRSLEKITLIRNAVASVSN
ncbi:hypothetical protein GYMLUDRAFT_202199 [Collybiopsis luxurians FD-317 M1]|uniref:Cytochrome P450 n=1 Tax=Collybiopsis luxurians FD-317 M1 TaxID=944289 RepID=A0A0D0B6A6_9AGAR|nr:hypothetical protein GYMLUDRAFT_202199 [Collybiopsis luxurians FD-317 M1]